MKSDLVTTDSAASALTGYSRSSLLKKRQAGLLPFDRDLRTGRVLYKLEDLQKLKRSCATE